MARIDLPFGVKIGWREPIASEVGQPEEVEQASPHATERRRGGAWHAASSLALVLGLIFFATPFVAVSCGSTPVAQLSGLNLSFGGTYGSGEQTRDYGPDLLFTIPLILLALALIAYLLFRGRAGILAAVASALAVITLITGQADFDSQVSSQSNGALGVQWSGGYWLTTTLAFLAFLMSVFGAAGLGAAARSHAPAVPPDRYGDLERAAKLRAEGVLTEAEFEQEKARILGHSPPESAL